jgi:phenylacetic acid degradation operon negative regulatory protein
MFATHNAMNRLACEEILDLFLWTMDTLTRPTLQNMLSGYEAYAHRRENLPRLRRLEHLRYLERVGGSGKEPVYRITAEGVRRARVTDPWANWNDTWDGQWRVVVFDLPEVRRKDRQVLWRALRAKKLGLLQRSVWIWPHPLQSILEEMIEAVGVPECFCGFTVRDLFLCNHAEVVASAWDWEAIERAHETYLRHPVLTDRAVAGARDLAQLASLARNERRSYAYAFAVDPLLPRDLWPQHYRGEDIQRQHDQFRRQIADRYRSLAAS